ncbi:amino acid ABC transporter permease [Candidatus Pelagibacter sp.]|nr:amino acid ABC transporter permease [Candidatus Pelagibacter sp.]
MKKINILKPNLQNLYFYLFLGGLFFGLSILDFCLNNFLEKNITSFLPSYISFFTPLFFGMLGLHFIRIEFSGIKLLDNLNKNINTNNFNAALSISIILLIIFSVTPLLNWFILEANFIGDSKESCTGEGACWVYIKVWLNRFIYGMYPNAEQWRVNLTFAIVLGLAIVGYITPLKYKKYLTFYYALILPIISFVLIYYLISGGEFGLEWVETGAWGGLSLTFIVSFFSLIFCFPIGMMLALGRRSDLPIVKYSSLSFIEFWRGVPLITVLFMSAVMFPMFLPDGTYVDKLIRVIVAITLFEAAYTAEVIRGGLQALPRGQYDAAKSLGMGYWKLHLLVILPQALKLVIPGIANTFLALVKDTPLIFVVGLLELVGMLNLAKTNPKWLGFSMEGYVFAGLIFWIICYSMSRYSQNLELKYKTDR